MAQTIFLTGASSGIGRAAAKLFHQRGWNVVATMRSPEKETELIKLPNVLVTRVDVREEETLQGAIKEGLESFSQIDVLLNNAGYGAYGLIEATSVDDMRKEFETNVIGTLIAIRAVAPYFRKQGNGIIVNMSSLGGKVAFPLGSLYHGSKFAVEGLTEALQYEMTAIGVTVKLIEPGMTHTNFSGSSFQFNNNEKLVEYRDVVRKTMAAFEDQSKSAGNAESVAETIYRAATDGTRQLRYVSGQDAVDMLKLRHSEDDDAFTGRLRALFGLEPASE